MTLLASIHDVAPPHLADGLCSTSCWMGLAIAPQSDGRLLKPTCAVRMTESLSAIVGKEPSHLTVLMRLAAATGAREPSPVC